MATVDISVHQDIIADILARHPCPQCGTVEVLRDGDVPGATCDCGRKEGCQTRWELADIWYAMTPDERFIAEESEEAINNAAATVA